MFGVNVLIFGTTMQLKYKVLVICIQLGGTGQRSDAHRNTSDTLVTGMALPPVQMT